MTNEHTPTLDILWKTYLEARRGWPALGRLDVVWRAYLPDELFMRAQEEVWASGPYVPGFAANGGLHWRAFEIHAVQYGDPMVLVSGRKHGEAYFSKALVVPSDAMPS
jgi:hypothetical protein